MTKRRRLSCSKQERESGDRCTLVDRISMLSDDLLVFMLSQLTFKQAAVTSVLSHRWRYLWTFTPSLDFDGTKFLLKADMNKRNVQSAFYKERRNYIRWVNDVIESRKDSITAIEYFKVFFNLNETHESHIDEWVRYALERKVQTLELDFTDDVCYKSHRYDNYTFPYKFLSSDKGDWSKYSQLWSLRHCNSIHFNHLKKILLNFVNVNADALEFFLCNCPLLEDLSVSESEDLLSLKITGPFLSLRCLEISMCRNLISVEIRDVNLVCFKYIGKRIPFLLENVPMLVNFTLGGTITDYMGDVALFSSIFPQLEIFKIYTTQLSWEGTETFYSAVKLINLKQLVVNAKGPMVDSFLPVSNLIRASPRLQRFVLEADPKYDLGRLGNDMLEGLYEHLMEVTFVNCLPHDVGRVGNDMIEGSYEHLKEVAFVGYLGGIIDTELVMHFVDNAIALEEIAVDPRPYCRTPLRYLLRNGLRRTVEMEKFARARIEKDLRNNIPPRINLRVLT